MAAMCLAAYGTAAPLPANDDPRLKRRTAGFIQFKGGSGAFTRWAVYAGGRPGGPEFGERAGLSSTRSASPKSAPGGTA